MIVYVADIFKSVFKGQYIEKFISPEVRLIIAHQQRHLFGYKNNAYCRQHPFDDG